MQNQNKFKIEEHFLAFIQKQLVEDKITAFVEALAEFDEFLPYVERWVEAEDMTSCVQVRETSRYHFPLCSRNIRIGP